jgi:PX domain
MEEDILSISIPLARQVMNEDNPYITYRLDISYGGWVASIEKRYSEFLDLHESIKSASKEFSLPLFPQKQRFKSIFKRFEHQYIQTRRVQLEQYMQALKNLNCVRKTETFPNFLSMPMDIREDWIEKFKKKRYISYNI